MFAKMIGFIAARYFDDGISYSNVLKQDKPFLYLRMHDYEDPKYLIESSGTNLVSKIDITTIQPNYRITGPLVNEADNSYGIELPTNDSYFVMNDATELANFLSYTDQGTVECWWKPYNLTESSYMLEVTLTTSDTYHLLLYYDWNDDNIKIQFKTSGTVGVNNWSIKTSTAINASTSTWMHLAFVSHDTGIPLIYVNGQQRATTTVSGTPSGQWFGDLSASANRLYIGAHVTNTGGSVFRPGRYSEFAVYNYKLDKQRIGYHYFKGIGAAEAEDNPYLYNVMGGYPQLFQRCDFVSGDHGNVVSSEMNSYDNDATNYGMVPFSATTWGDVGIPGVPKDKSIYFNDTVGGSVRTDTTTTGLVSGNTEGSIEGWIKTDLETGYIFMISDTASTNDFIYINHNSSGISAVFRNSTGTWGANYFQHQWYNIDLKLDGEDWHHIVVTSGSGSEWDLWIDGIKLTRTGSQGTLSNKWFGDLTGLDYFLLSRYEVSGTNNMYAGSFSNIAIYDYVLSDQQIKNNYYAGYFENHPYYVYAHELEPVATWDFSRTSGDVTDRGSDNCDHLTVNGTPLRAQIDFFNGQNAMDFDGSTDSLSRTDANTSIGLTGTHTIICWIKTTTNAAAAVGIVGQYHNGGGYTNQRGSVVYLDSSEYFTMAYSSDGTTGVGVAGSTALNDGEWHMCAATYAASSRVAVFVDGKLENKATSSIPASLHASTGPFEIGVYWDGTRYFTGQIADVAIYEKQLLGEEIGLLYYIANHTNTYETAYPKKQVENGATIVIPIQDPAGSATAIMACSTNNNVLKPAANYNGSTVPGATGSPLGTSCWFPGTDTGTHNLGLDSLDTYLDDNAEGSVEIWFRCYKENENTNATLACLTKGTGSGNYVSFYITVSTGVLYWQANNGSNQLVCYASPKNLSDERWHHAVFTVETGVGNRMYVDGVKQTLTYVVGTSSTTSNAFYSSMATATTYKLGHRYYTGEPTNDAKFRGDLCGFGFYADPLTDAEVLDNYLTAINNAPSYINYIETVLETQPVAYWRLNASSTGVERDLVEDIVLTIGSTVTERTASLLTSTALKIHEDNYCMDFDGTTVTGIATAPANEASLQITGTLSISMWIAADDYTAVGDQILIDCIGATGDGVSADNCLYRFMITTTGVIRAFWEYSTGTNEQNDGTVSLGAADGETIHLGIIRNSADNKVYVYKNGVLHDTISYTNDASGGGNADFCLGQAVHGSGPYAGKMQEVAIYNKDIGADGMKRHYQAGIGQLT